MLQALCEIAKRAGKIILSAHDPEKTVREKTSHWDLVTKYDSMVQSFLQDELLTLLPEAGFLGEEDGKSSAPEGCKWLFIVDPIDGTSNFVRGFRCSCVSIGLLHEGQVRYGVVYNPYTGELFSAEAGKGAFLNGVPIHVSERDLEHGFLLFGSGLYYRELVEKTLAVFNRIFPRIEGVRRFGSAAMDLCYLASGRAECFFELRLCPWDYAAGSLIVREAGGIVTQPDGTDLNMYEKCPVLACNQKTYDLLRAIMAEVEEGDCNETR